MKFLLSMAKYTIEEEEKEKYEKLGFEFVEVEDKNKFKHWIEKYNEEKVAEIFDIVEKYELEKTGDNLIRWRNNAGEKFDAIIEYFNDKEGKEIYNILEKQGFDFTPTKNKDYCPEYSKTNKKIFIEINTLEDLLKMENEYGRLIIQKSNITIYDDYIE